MELGRISETRTPVIGTRHLVTPNVATTASPPADGYQPSHQQIPATPSLAKPTATQVTNFPLVDEQGYQTLFITASPDERGRSEIPYEASEELEALSKENGDKLKVLSTSDGAGANLFAQELVLRAHSSKLDVLNEALAKHPTLKAVNMAEVLNAAPSATTLNDELIKAVSSGDLASRAQATRSLARLFSGQSKPTVDEATRNTMADGVLDTAHGLLNLFNASLIEETRERKHELIQERKKAEKESIGEAFNGYFNAAEKARDELRARGGTATINRLSELSVEAFGLLGNLDTKRAHAFRSQMLVHGDGALLKEVIANPEQAEQMVDYMADVVDDRAAQTQKYLAMPHDQVPKTARGTRSSSGYTYLPGRQENISIHEWSPNYPYDDIPTGSLVLLGTEHSAMVRDKLEAIFLKADADLPQMQADHREQEVGQELKSALQRIESYAEELPADKRETFRSRAVESEKARVEKNYSPLNTQADVRRLAESLAWINFSNDDLFSENKAQSETALLVAGLLPKLQSPDMHKLLADVALQLWDRSDKVEPEAKAALLAALLQPGADADVRIGAATRLLTQGELGVLSTAVEGLSHDNDEVRRATVSALGVGTAVTHDRPVQNADGLVAKLATPMARMNFQAALSSAAQGQLEKLLQDPDSIWIRTESAKILADLGTDSPAAISMLRELFADDGATVSYSKDNFGRKNAVARTNAADMLANFGKAAADAVPDLQAAVKIAEQARTALTVVDKRREELKGQPFESQSDPACREAMAAALKSGGESFQTALTFLEDPKSPRPEDIPSYSRDRYPFAEAALREAVKVGETAARALSKIQTG